MKQFTISGRRKETARMIQMLTDVGYINGPAETADVCVVGGPEGHIARDCRKQGIPVISSERELQEWLERDMYDPEANYRDSLADDGCIPICEPVHYSSSDMGNIDCSPVSESSPAIKFDSNKHRFDLIPVEALEEVAKVFTYGATKYAPRNWEKGMDWGRVFAAMMRHSWAFWRGETHDPETGFHHMAHAAFGCLALIQYTIKGWGNDDRQ